MSILLIILLVIAALIVLLLVAAASTRSAYTIEQDITINRPVQDVFNYIKFLKNQDYYNKWVMIDPTMKKEFRGTDGTPGFVYAWDSNSKQVGKGEQEIKSITPASRIDHEIRFDKPFQSTSTATLVTQSQGNAQTRVTWIYKGTMNFMMKLFTLLFNMKKMLAKDMQTSLGNLKNTIERS